MEHEHLIDTHRIEAFSDGVFAIIVTLLVLDLKIPEIAGSVTNEGAMNALVPLLPQFLSFFLSFMIICVFWVNHHQFYYAIKKVDRKLLWLNNILLFWLCFIPFPTGFLGRHPTNEVAVILFGSVLLLATVSFFFIGYYARFRSHLYDEHISFKERKKSQVRAGVSVVFYAFSILLAPVSVYFSLFIFILVPILYAIPRRIVFS